MKVEVIHFSRRPDSGAYSIERVFNDVRAALPEGISVIERQNTYLSQGILPRLKDALAARKAAREVNHVVGDVHYLTYFLPGRRTVLTVHDTVLVDRERGLKRFVLWVLWYWLPLKCCRHVTTISDESLRRLRRIISIPPERIEVIPNPISSEFVFMPQGPRHGPLRVLHIGTKANKNLERLVVALSGLDVELTVIGPATERQRSLVSSTLPRHRFLQNLNDVQLRAEYVRTDVLAFFSLEEGFGLPIIEAQATGRPVLTSDRPPMTEVAGGAALLADPEDVAAMRAAVLKVMGEPDLRRELIDKGLENVRRYSAENIARMYATLYEKIARETNHV